MGLQNNHIERKRLFYGSRIFEVIEKVINSDILISGPEVGAFEAEFAEYIGSKFCIGVGNGTDALELAVECLEMPPGKRVACAANAGPYASRAIRHNGLVPVFCDIDLGTHCLTLSGLEEAYRIYGSSLGCVIYTHLYGLFAEDFHRIVEFCSAHDIALIEDCAQAHGARSRGLMAGCLGKLATYSFYPTKNLGGIGDGGAVITSDESLALKLRALREYGWSSSRYNSTSDGRNTRLDELQAACLRLFLKDLNLDNERRRQYVQTIAKNTNGNMINMPISAGANHVYHLFVITVTNRDHFIQHLRNNKVWFGIHYPIMDNEQLPNLKFKHETNLKNTAESNKRIVSLPVSPYFGGEEANYLSKVLNSYREF
jgi:aminotransferase EvaB